MLLLIVLSKDMTPTRRWWRNCPRCMLLEWMLLCLVKNPSPDSIMELKTFHLALVLNWWKEVLKNMEVGLFSLMIPFFIFQDLSMLLMDTGNWCWAELSVPCFWSWETKGLFPEMKLLRNWWEFLWSYNKSLFQGIIMFIWMLQSSWNLTSNPFSAIEERLCRDCDDWV